MTTIHNIEDLALEVCGDKNASFSSIEKAVYDGTSCGAWISIVSGVERDGIHVGSMVEGSDAEFSADPIWFPFDSKELWEATEYVDGEASAEWEMTNNEDGEWD